MAKTSARHPQAMGIAYGIFYGGLVAGIYLLTRIWGQDGGLNAFAAVALIAFCIHAAVFPRQTLSGLRQPKMLLRGALFSLTQVLIFKAQATGFTSTALVASTMGSVFGVLLGRILLKERLEGLSLVAGGLCIGAVLLNPSMILHSHWGILGGLIQGSGFVLARSLMLDQKSIRESIACGYGVGAVIGFITLAVTSQIESITLIPVRNLAILVIMSLVIQYAFFYLYKILDSQRASMLLLSRIPWAQGLEFVFFGATLVVSQLSASVMILLGAILLVADAKRTQHYKTSLVETTS
jgi:drug/metabolite transporter (DMT)-like permease